MASKKPTRPIPGRFKPGQSGNPSGRPKMSAEARAFRRTSYDEFISKIQEFISLTPKELNNILSQPETTNFSLIFGQMVRSAAEGDAKARCEITDRLWGKVKEVTLDDDERKRKDELRQIPADQLAAYVRSQMEAAKLGPQLPDN